MTAATLHTSDREHGYARYKLENCRCYTCCYAVSVYNQKRNEAIAAGTWRADTGPIQIHIRSLMVAGMGYKRIAALAGVSESTVGALLYGRRPRNTPPPKTTRYDIGQKILAVQLDLAPNSHIEASGTVRRIQALAALGNTLGDVAERIGWTLQNLSTLVRHGSVPYAYTVVVRTAQTVGRVYDELSMLPPTGPAADRARERARRNGWFPPLAWDDDTIDDPNALPCVLPPAGDIMPGADELALQHLAAGHGADLNSPTRVELAHRLAVSGVAREDIAHLLNTSVAMVTYLRSRHPLGAEEVPLW